MEYEGELIAVIQFCYPRTAAMKREYSAELLRLAFKRGVRVYRGASALIHYYIENYKPADFFTYQDMSGEVTSVYEHAGMTLVSQAKKKDYLVAPGKTIETGSRKEVLGMAYATRYGPDRTIGTKLGEVYREDGTRKSNKDIFIEDLGWHIETTAGDRVYEWINPERTHYTYKITALDSDKYYFGVHTLKKSEASLEECLNDGYMGSGGQTENNKLKNWKNAHATTLQKTVLKRYARKAHAYIEEEELVGDLWTQDSLCLNSAPGGRRNAPVHSYGTSIIIANCEKHGSVAHRPGGKCISCVNETEVGYCPLHKSTVFQADACAKCKSVRIKQRKCSIHGLADHRSSVCLKCAELVPGELLCIPHELPINKKDKLKRCLACIAERRGEMKCEIHQEYYRYGSCQSCRAIEKEKVKNELAERKAAAKLKREAVSVRKVTFSQQNCEIHGLVTFRGEECIKCQTNSRITEKHCEKHGMTKHQGDTCGRCSVGEAISTKHCEKHGETSFTGDSCNRCRSESSVAKKHCEKHGFVTHVGDKCRLCVNQKAVNLKHCEIHGMVKHQGEKCSSCSSMATAHRLHHGKKPNKKCHLCVAEGAA